MKKDKGKYFGPYPHAFAASETKKLLDRLYPYRKCHTMPDRVCLYYHLGQCLAPCVNEVDEETYKEMVDDITRFLNGGYKECEKRIDRKNVCGRGKSWSLNGRKNTVIRLPILKRLWKNRR